MAVEVVAVVLVAVAVVAVAVVAVAVLAVAVEVVLDLDFRFSLFTNCSVTIIVILIISLLTIIPSIMVASGVTWVTTF